MRYQHTVARADLQRDAVQPWVFPAGVIDEVVAVDEFEDASTDPIEHRHAAAPGRSPAGYLAANYLFYRVGAG